MLGRFTPLPTCCQTRCETPCAEDVMFDALVNKVKYFYKNVRNWSLEIPLSCILYDVFMLN